MNDGTMIFGLAVAVLTTVVATAYGLLPDRIDLSVVFAAYGSGAIIGELLGALPGRDAHALSRRWGVALMSLIALALAAGLLGALH